MAQIVTIDGIPVYQALVDAAGDTGMLRISLVDDPAVQSDFMAFKNQEARKALTYAVQDEEKHLVLGVVMRADFPIYRRDPDGFEYYVLYKADTIRIMAEKYLAENRQNLVNLMHVDGTEQEGVQMVQYFIKDSAKGVAPAGFDVADGSLLAEFHVTNEDVWTAIKAGTYRGFSLEGLFDLAPEHDAEAVQHIVDSLEGRFKTILKNNNMAKMKGLLARLARAIVNLGNITTDRGILSWDGDDELAVGNAVYIEDAEGGRTPAEDGEYKTTDNKTIVVADGKVAAILESQVTTEPAAEPAAAAEPEPAAEPAAEPEKNHTDTDKGTLVYEGDLAAGTAVSLIGEDGTAAPAPDGEYTAADGSVIVVAEGVVTEVRPAAAAEPAQENQVQTQGLFARVREAFAESYDDKWRKIAEAIAALGFDGWVIEVGDEYAILETWTEQGYKYNRFKIEWDGDGNAVASDPVLVVPAFVTPEEKEAADEAFRSMKEDYEKVKAALEEMKRTPAAKPAHEVFNGQGEAVSTGNKGLDRLARIASAK